VKLHWYDGGIKPPRPEGLSEADSKRYFALRAEGIMYVGDKGIIIGGFNGDSPHLIPDSEKYKAPPVNRGEVRRDIVTEQFVAACKGGPQAAANFEAQAPVTEAFLLGCISQRMPGESLRWDSAGMTFTNSKAANQYIDAPYRPGWA
jgi:hypothetical protein